MLDQLGNGLLLGIIISVASVALSLLYGVTRIVNFAHGEIIALGAIMTLFFSSPVDYRVLFLDKYSPLGYNFALSCILAVIVCGLFGALLEICLFFLYVLFCLSKKSGAKKDIPIEWPAASRKSSHFARH